MSKDTDPLGRLIRENIEMASNQIKHNVEMGTAMTNSFIKDEWDAEGDNCCV